MRDPSGHPIGEAGLGNRKDVRNAVEAAHRAKAWSEMNAHGRAQVMFYIAENLSARAQEFGARLANATGASSRRAREEVTLWRRYDYLVINRDVKEAVDQITAIVHAERCRTTRLSLRFPDLEVPD